MARGSNAGPDKAPDMAHCKSTVARKIGIAPPIMAAPAPQRAPAADDIALLLPWHAAGTLNDQDSRRVTAALADDAALARQYAGMLLEYAEVSGCDDDLGAPSPRAMQQLFAAIDADEGRPAPATGGCSIVALRSAGTVRRWPRGRPMMVKKILRCV